MTNDSASSASIARGVVLATFAFGLVATFGCTSLMQVIDFEKQVAQAGATSRIEGWIDTEGPYQGVLVVILGRLVEGQEKLIGIDSYVRVNPGS